MRNRQTEAVDTAHAPHEVSNHKEHNTKSDNAGKEEEVQKVEDLFKP